MLQNTIPEIPILHIRQQAIRKLGRALDNYPPRQLGTAVIKLAKATQRMPPRDTAPPRPLFNSKTEALLNSRHK
jgi:hypothetical protein